MTSPCPTTPLGRSVCARVLIAGMAMQGVEVTVSTAPPLVRSRYTERFPCPHGVTYWMEPTGEQYAAWAEAGMP